MKKKAATKPTNSNELTFLQSVANEKANLPPMIVPLVLTEADKSLTPEQVKFASELGAKFPKVVEAVSHFNKDFATATEKMAAANASYFVMCSELRTAKLNRRESTLLLKGLGMIKQRITEVLRVTEVSDELWAKYEGKALGFRAVLKIARTEDASDETEPTQATVPGTEPETTVKPLKPQVVIHEIKQPLKGALMQALREAGELRKNGEQTEYALGFVHEDKRFYIALTVGTKVKGEA